MSTILVLLGRTRLRWLARRIAARLGLSGIVTLVADYRERHGYFLAHTVKGMSRLRWSVLLRLVLVAACITLARDVIVIGMRFQFLVWIAFAFTAWRLKHRRWRLSGSHGTAAVASLPDLARGGLLCNRGLVLGKLGFVPGPSRIKAITSLVNPLVRSELAYRYFIAAFLGPRWLQDDYIRINDFVNLATFSPAGGGKSVSVLLPNLLSYAGNCVVIDPKGELFRLTARHRKGKFGHRIVRIDPALLMGPNPDCFNPLDAIKPADKDFIGQCRALAKMIVMRTGEEHDPHFNDAAENVIASFIAYSCGLEGNPKARNLGCVRDQLVSRKNYDDARDIMIKYPGFYGVLEQLAQSLGWHVDRELGSVMSSAQQHTHVFGEPLIDESTSSTTFDPRLLRHGRMTIYVMVPAERLTVWAGYLRVVLGSLLRAATPGQPTERNPVLFMVDECAHLGKLQVLEDAVTLMRGMGIRLWLFYQSIEQLKQCFGANAGTVLDKIATQQYFRLTSLETSETLSRRIGDTTIVVRTQGDNDGTSMNMGGDDRNPGSRSSGTNTSYSETARRLFRPEEILTLRSDAGLVFHKETRVVVAKLIKHYADKAFRRRGRIFRSWGTGRSPVLSPGGGIAALLAVLLAIAATVAVPRLPQQPRWRVVVPAPHRPGRRPDGRVRPSPHRPLPRSVPRGRQSFTSYHSGSSGVR